MKSINFFSIEEHRNDSREEEQDQSDRKPVNFFELSSERESSSDSPVVVHSDIHHSDSVNFFEITSEGEGGESDSTISEEIDNSEQNNDPNSNEEEKTEEDPTKEVSSNIVVVEDDNIVSTMLKHLLERRGFSIEIASDGRRASEIVENEMPPALVILDVMLPFVDGFELIRKIRSNEKWKAVPIVMLTAKTRETDIVRALEAGADDYVSKPFQPQELIARVKRFVRKT